MSASAAEKVTSVEGITEYRLANGLRILLYPDGSKPVVTVNLTVLVGSRHEGYGETGMAHLLEHMVFKGTPQHPNVPKALRDHGASFNGTTWVDRTNYFETMPATDENLEFGIALEADRMVNSFVKREDLISEMTVVRNEFERGENDPQRVLSQRMLAAAYEWHNYGKSTIGNRSDIERVPIENLQAFYKKFYQPDNAVLVIAGQFDSAKALAMIDTHFGKLPKPRRTLDLTYTEEPAQDGERTVTLRRVGKVGGVGAAYHIVAGSHPDFPAVELLDVILTDEPSGRLYKALVETKLATSISGAAFGWHDPGVLQVGATCEPDKIAVVRTKLLETCESFVSQPATVEEVDRAKRQTLQRLERLMNDSSRVAITLSDWAAKGDWRLFFLHRDRLEKVTPADVTRVATQFLARNNRTVGVFEPSEKAERVQIAAAPAPSDQVKAYAGRTAVVQGEAFDPTPANLDQRTQLGSLGGLKTALLPRRTSGATVTLQLSLGFGNEQSLNGRTAAAGMLGSMMQRGTQTMTRQQIEDELDKLGATLRVSSSTGTLTANITAKRDTLPKTLMILGEILRKPAFPADEFDKLVRARREDLQQSSTEPQALAGKALQRRLSPYPADDVRYPTTVAEDLVRLNNTTLDDVKSLYTEQVGAGAGELAVVGDFDPAEVKGIMGDIVGGWQAKTPYRRIVRQVLPGIKAGVETILTPDKENAVFLGGIAFPVMDSSPDYPALKVGSYLLGEGSLASRLANRIRQKEGLSYGVGSNVQAGVRDEFGALTLFAITNPGNMKRVDQCMVEELDKFLTEGVGLSELREGQAAYLQQMQVGRTSDRAIASTLIENLQAGRTFQHLADLEKKIAALTPDDVTAAFKKHIAAGKLAVIQAGDFKPKN